MFTTIARLATGGMPPIAASKGTSNGMGNWIRRIILISLVGGLSVVAALPVALRCLDSTVTRYARNFLREKAAGIPFDIDLAAAELRADRGIVLQQVQVTSRHGELDAQLLIDQIVVDTRLDPERLWQQEIEPDAIHIIRPRLKCVCLSNGRLVVPDLSQLFSGSPLAVAPDIPIRISEGTLEFLDVSDGRSIVLRDVSLVIRPEKFRGETLTRVDVECGGDILQRFAGTLYYRPSNQTIRMECHEGMIELSDRLVALISTWLPPPGTVDHVQGQVQVVGSIEAGLAPPRIDDFEVRGQVSRVALASDLLPMTVRNTAFEFAVDPSGFAIERASGIADEGPFHVSYRQTGWLERQSWAVEGDFKNVQFRPSMLDWFPVYCRRFANEFNPTGVFDIRFQMDSEGRRNIHADLLDMGFQYIRFPYPMRNCVGSVDWIDNLCRYNVQALEGHQVLRIYGHVLNPGRGATYQCHVATDGPVPIDQKLYNAIDYHPEAARVVRAFNATGQIQCRGLIEKRTPDQPMATRSFDIDLLGCTVRHELFNYPLYDIHGTVRMRNSNYSFENIVGRNSTLEVTSNGHWTPEFGLAARHHCEAIPLDTQLRSALPVYLQDIWDGFRPKGTVGSAVVDLRLAPGQPSMDITVDAELGTQDDTTAGRVSIRPVWFPYELRQLSGRVRVGQGQILLENFRGKHGRAWVQSNGQGDYSHDQWKINLSDILATALPVDEDLLSAMPEGLSQSVRGIRYRGLVTVSGNLVVGGKIQGPDPAANHPYPIQQVGFLRDATAAMEPPSGIHMDWQLRLDVDQAQMDIGLPLRNVFGHVDLIGRQYGEQAETYGEVVIDSLTAYGVQATGIRGPIWIDNNQVLTGHYVQTKLPDLEPRSIAGTLFAGQFQLDAQLKFQGENPFFIQAALSNAQLREFAMELAPQFRELSGDVFAWLKLTGNTMDYESMRGTGAVQLRNAEIYELPVMLALLKILRIKEATRTAFDTCIAEFQVFGDELEFQRIELNGDAISLIGNGKMNLDWDIDLNFYSVMGRNRWYIPLVTEILKAGAQSIMWIEVDGKLDSPQTHTNILPQLNDSLKQLFYGSSSVPR